MSPVIAAAARGVLPDWACAKPKRREHIARVAELMNRWALELAPQDAELWTAAAWLHDALRDADPAALRPEVDAAFKDWPDALLHGPAASARVRREQPDAPASVLNAVAYHTVGHADLDLLGRALYLADYLEPGRRFDPESTAALRARMPGDFAAVLREVVRARMAQVTARGAAVRPETAGFWQSIDEG